MLYLLDANVLITAHSLYYGMQVVPEFWTWLAHRGAAGNLKIPLEIYEEVRDGSTDDERDLLFGWLQEDANRSAMLLDEEVDQALVGRIVREGYAPDLTDDQIGQIGNDPFLIAYALAAPADRCVVTTEVSKPTRTRHNRHIPDVCGTLGVTCCDTFAMLRALGFTTGWNRRA
jgi:hypothetical protein